MSVAICKPRTDTIRFANSPWRRKPNLQTRLGKPKAFRQPLRQIHSIRRLATQPRKILGQIAATNTSKPSFDRNQVKPTFGKLVNSTKGKALAPLKISNVLHRMKQVQTKARSHQPTVETPKPSVNKQKPTLLRSNPCSFGFSEAVVEQATRIKKHTRKRTFSDHLKISRPKTETIRESASFVIQHYGKKTSSPGYTTIPNAPESDDEDEQNEWVDTNSSSRRLKKKCHWLGVSWNSQHGKWIAQVGYLGKRHYVGQFEDCNLAAKLIDEFCVYKLHIPPRNGTIPTPDYLKDARRRKKKQMRKSRKGKLFPRKRRQQKTLLTDVDWTEHLCESY